LPFIKAGVSVSVNGQIVTDLNAPVAPEDEVYLIQRIKGG
jgi:sulfur carrier protein ThiS